MRFPAPVWALPASLAATGGISFDSSSSGYLDVSVHRVPSSHSRGDSTTTAGFPHSEICGSLVTCTSPQLIAAYRVLLRLIWPRHPPYALTYLTYLLSFLRFELSNFLKRSFLFLTFSCSCQGTVERIDLSKLNNTNPCHSADLKMETCTGRSLYTLIYP